MLQRLGSGDARFPNLEYRDSSNHCLTWFNHREHCQFVVQAGFKARVEKGPGV